MSLVTVPKTVKWPFFVGDALLVGLAWVFYRYAELPFSGPTLLACIAAVGLGALLGILPFLLDYRAEIRFVEATEWIRVAEQIKGLESVASTISSATGQWQGVQEHATRTVESAQQIADKMNAEIQAFMEFVEKANTAEKQYLTLEVEKLKRAESDWLGVLVRILDHVYAITSAARRAGQENITNQLMQFQLACRDAARRVGLVPFEAEPGAEFDPDQHQLPEEAPAPEGARISEVLATGYTFRGQKLRPAIVALQAREHPSSTEDAVEPAEPPAPASEGTNSEQELSL